MVRQTWFCTGFPSHQTYSGPDKNNARIKQETPFVIKEIAGKGGRTEAGLRIYTLCHWVLRFRCRTGIEWNGAAPPSCCCGTAAAGGCVRWPEKRADLMLFIVAGTAAHEDGGGDLRGQDGRMCGIAV